MKMLYTDLNVRVFCETNFSDEFKLKTGVKQECLLSPFSSQSALTGSWKTIKNNRKEITWTLTKSRDDQDFVDDIALLSHRHSDLQEKPTVLQNAAVKTYLKINNVKTKVMMINAKSEEPITLGGTIIEY